MPTIEEFLLGTPTKRTSRSLDDFILEEEQAFPEPIEPSERGPLPPATSPAFPRPGQEVEFVFEGQPRATGAPVKEPIREGAPLFERFKASFALDPQEMKRSMEEGVSKAFGKTITFDTDISGNVVFRNPETGQLTPVNPPGLEVGDFLDLAGPAITLISEALGAALGAVSPWPQMGSIAVGALGAYIGEILRLKSGQTLGVNADLTDEEIMNQAIRMAGLAGVGGAAGTGLTKLGFAIVTRFRAGNVSLPSVLTEAGEDISGARTAARPVQREVKRLTGEELPLTSTQLTGSPELAAGERVLMRRASGRPIKEVREQQERALTSLEETIKDPFSTTSEIQRTGQAIQERAARGPKRGIGVVERQTEAARQTALDEAALQTRGYIPPSEAGALARETLETGRDSIQKAFSRRYADLDTAAADLAVDLENFRTVGQKWENTVKEDLLPRLTTEDVSVIKDAAKAGIKKVKPSTILSPRGAPVIPGHLVLKPVSFSTIQRTVSTLREEVRLMRKGVSPRREIIAMQELRDALLRDRNKALAKRPDILGLVENLEAGYAESKSIIDRTMIGQILKRREGGGFVMRDDQVIRRILSSPSGAKEISRAISDPKFGSLAPSRDAIRRGILGEYQVHVIDSETGLAAIYAHKTFMRQKSQSMRHFFDPKEMADLQRPGAATRFLKEMEKRETRITQELNQTFGMKLSRYDSGEVIEKTFNPNKLGNVRRLKTLLRNDPDKWKDYQALTLQEMWGKISSYNNQKTAFEVNPALLANWTTGKRAALLREVHGPELVKNLTILQRVLTVARREITADGDALVQSMMGDKGTALRDVSRAYVGLFTRPGRAMTAAIRIRGKAAERVIARAIADPAELQRLVNLRNMGAKSARAGIVFGQLGATILAYPELEDAEITQ